jgi:hypothetical protein
MKNKLSNTLQMNLNASAKKEEVKIFILLNSSF